jgi:hypothetical protein
LQSILSVAGTVAILVLGCQHAAMAYRLHRQGADAVLLPPMQAVNATESSDFSVVVKRARQMVPRVPGCDIEGDLFLLHWQGTAAHLSLRSQSFFASSADQSPMQIGTGMYADPLLGIEKFRSELSNRQSRGCLDENDSERLRRAMVENFPLPSAASYFLQLGSYDITGYFDLTPDFRLHITSPIYPESDRPVHCQPDGV